MQEFGLFESSGLFQELLLVSLLVRYSIIRRAKSSSAMNRTIYSRHFD